ncbi:MAG: bacteriohemerythrin [Myxococcota bacterium]
MSTLNWDKKLELDVPEIDVVHQRLVAMMGKLEDQVKGGRPKAEVAATFTALAEATKKHFADEERYMASVGYDATQHKVAHQKLLATLTVHYDRFKADPAGQIPQPVFDFLALWLRTHISGVDRHYADHAHAHPVARAARR